MAASNAVIFVNRMKRRNAGNRRSLVGEEPQTPTGTFTMLLQFEMATRLPSNATESKLCQKMSFL